MGTTYSNTDMAQTSQGAHLTTFRAQAAGIYSQLQDAFARAATYVEAHLDELDAAVAGGVRTLENQVGSTLPKLAADGSMTLAVLAGEKTPAQWQALADVVADAITSLARYTGDALPTFRRLVAEVVTPTATQLVAEVRDGVAQALDVTPWVAAALIALVVGYVVFTFRS